MKPDSRHTYASRLVRQGRDLRSVQGLLGHKSLTSTMIYAHLAPDHVDRAREPLDAPAARLAAGNDKSRPPLSRRTALGASGRLSGTPSAEEGT